MKLLFSAILIAGTLIAPYHSARAAETLPENILRLSVDDCIRIALKSAPELGEAQADIALTTSKLDEAKSHRFPQLDVTALAGPAPEARKEELFTTGTNKFHFDRLTWFASTNATIIQPIYTFGKISENMKAATHGIEVDRSRKDQRANEITQKVREYYYSLLLARDMKELVLEVQETLSKARVKAKKLIDQGSESVEEMDLYKLDAFSGEAAKYFEEANKGERLALAALKTRLGLPISAPIDISSERLAMGETSVPEYETFVERARKNRPEYRQIEEGLKARAALVEAAKANYYPDIFLAGLVSWAYAENRDRIDNPYITDPFQHLYAGVALGARWKLDFGITGARVAGEQAQHNRLMSTKEFAEANIPLQIKKFYLELKEAENNAQTTKQAYTSAKKWGMAAVANFDFGIGPSQEMFEALQSYVRLRAAYFQSVFNYHMALANLEYATGQPPVSINK
jgi:outer membrane protein TolC